MAVTETRLYGPAQPGTVTGVLYTVPALTDTVIKQVVMANTTALPATVTIGIGGTTAADRIIPTITVAANTAYTFDCAIPLAAGETLDGLQGTSGAVTVTVVGYEIA